MAFLGFNYYTGQTYNPKTGNYFGRNLKHRFQTFKYEEKIKTDPKYKPLVSLLHPETTLEMNLISLDHQLLKEQYPERYAFFSKLSYQQIVKGPKLVLNSLKSEAPKPKL